MTAEEYNKIMNRLKSKLLDKNCLNNHERGFNEGIRRALSIVHSFKPDEKEEVIG